MIRSLIGIVVLASSVPADAQWLNYPTQFPAPPMEPDLAAPAPRTANGGPDISGIWQNEPSCPTEGCVRFVTDDEVGQEFRNLGWKLPGGIPYQPRAAELFARRSAQLGEHDPVASCRPPDFHGWSAASGNARAHVERLFGRDVAGRYLGRRDSGFAGWNEIEVTIDDPKAYTRPWTVTLTHLLMPDTELLDYHCTDYDAEAVEPSGDGSAASRDS